MMVAKLVDPGVLLKIVGASLGAGLCVMVAFSLVILGATRSMELRRDGSGVAAGAYAALAVLSFAFFVAAVVYGIHVMATKS